MYTCNEYKFDLNQSLKSDRNLFKKKITSENLIYALNVN